MIQPFAHHLYPHNNPCNMWNLTHPHHAQSFLNADDIYLFIFVLIRKINNLWKKCLCMLNYMSTLTERTCTMTVLLAVIRTVMWKPWNSHLHRKASLQVTTGQSQEDTIPTRVHAYMYAFHMFTFGQIFAEVHDCSHVTVHRGIRMGDGGLRLS